MTSDVPVKQGMCGSREEVKAGGGRGWCFCVDLQGRDVTGKGLIQEWVCLRTAISVWVLDFMQEKISQPKPR